MNVFVLYLLLLKATMTSFSGLASLPIIRDDLVVEHHVLTDRQLSAAVAAGRLGPGPIGLYVVSVGYFVAGTPGAIAGWAAMITPAFIIIPLLRYLGSRAGHPRVKGAIRAVTNAAAGLIVAAAAPLAAEVINGPVQVAIAAGALLALALTRIDTIWVIAASALAGLAGAFMR
jgi:chromate transporter